MEYRESDVVKVKTDKYKNINIGDIGTIITVFNTPNEAYEVEFLDDDGMVREQGVFLKMEIERLDY